MKKYLLLITFIISLFNLTHTMEQCAMDTDFNYYGPKEIVQDIFDKNEKLEDIFQEIMKFFDTLEFYHSDSFLYKLEFIKCIKQLVNRFYELKYAFGEILTKKLKKSVEKNIGKILTPNLIHRILILICSGVNPNVKISYDNIEVPLLNYCILTHGNGNETYVSIIYCLLIYGANVNYSDDKNDAPVFLASMAQNLDLIRLLVIFEASVDSIHPRYGSSIFDNIQRNCDEKTLLAFLGYGHKFKFLTTHGDHFTTWQIDPKALKLFIRYGLDINTLNKSGATALRGLVISSTGAGSIKLLKILLKNGALDLPDKRGITAYEYAVELEDEDSISIFEKYSISLLSKTNARTIEELSSQIEGISVNSELDQNTIEKMNIE